MPRRTLIILGLVFGEQVNLAYNNQKHFREDAEAGGAKFATSSFMTWRNNVAEHNLGRGFWCDWVCLNNTVVSNIARYNDSFGIQWEMSGFAVIASNLLHHNHAFGIQLIGSQDMSVYNNTLDANADAILVIQDSRRTGNPSASGVVSNIGIFNNLFSNTDGVQEDFLEVDDNTHTVTGSTMISGATGGVDYNGYYRASSTMPLYVTAWANNTGGDTLYATLATFHSATGNEAHGIAIDNQGTNPFFTNEATGQYTLLAGSPAQNTGVPLPTNVANAIGVGAGVPVNLGALVWPAS